METTETALLIIDMQNDLVDSRSPACIPGALATVARLQELLRRARQEKWLVVHVVREYRRDCSDIELSRADEFRQRPYLVPGTNGAEIIDQLEPLEGELRLVKSRFSAFMFTPLDSLLRRRGIRHVVVSGTQYPNCIRATSFDALSLDYRVTVVTDATSAATPEVAEANIFDLRNVGIQCTALSEL